MPEIKNRMTVVERVHHQIPGSEPGSVESTFSRELESDEQPYLRFAKAAEDWQPLDLGWVEQVGMLCISNDEGRNLSVVPTDDEKAETAKKILEITYNVNGEECWIVLPKESMRANPSHPKNLFIRSQHGTVRITIYVIPR